MNLSRRGVVGGLGLLVAAPAIVRASSLMAVKVVGPAVGPNLTATDILQRYFDRLINPPFIETDFGPYRALCPVGSCEVFLVPRSEFA